MPMKDIISVVMISFTPYQARSTAGTTVHSAPTAAPIAITTTSVSPEPSASTSDGARPAAKAAPSRNWPSAPRFHRFARKATIRPAAIRSSGDIRMMLS